MISKRMKARIREVLEQDIDDRQRVDLMAEALNDAHLEYSYHLGRQTSQSEFTRHIGVAQTSYSQWVSGLRLPTGNNVHILANAIGPMIYDIIGEPRRIPDDPMLVEVVECWMTLPYEMREDLFNSVRGYMCRDDVEVNDNGGGAETVTT